MAAQTMIGGTPPSANHRLMTDPIPYRADEEAYLAIYGELKGLAAHYLRSERPDHTLQPTALVHEAYLRLGDALVFSDRSHFFATAARAMRHVLVDHARRRNAAKRSATRVSLTSMAHEPEWTPDLLDLDRALDQLRNEDTQRGLIVDLHFFGGLTVQEIAKIIDASERTVFRKLRSSKAWLKATLVPSVDASA
ncbi:MAG: ECF-type sigma factor [Acidobacteriota bacterium]